MNPSWKLRTFNLYPPKRLSLVKVWSEFQAFFSDKMLPSFPEVVNNVTVTIGQNAELRCKVENLNNYKVCLKYMYNILAFSPARRPQRPERLRELRNIFSETRLPGSEWTRRPSWPSTATSSRGIQESLCQDPPPSNGFSTSKGHRSQTEDFTCAKSTQTQWYTEWAI